MRPSLFRITLLTLAVVALGCDTRSSSTSSTPAAGAGSTQTTVLNLIEARTSHEAVLLNGGEVVLLGGQAANGAALSSVEFFDGVQQSGPSFFFLGSLLQARFDFGAVPLSNGLIFCVGGNDGNGNSLFTTELFNPATGVSTFGPNLTTGRTAAAVFPYQDGAGAEKVAIAGGLNFGASTTALLDWEAYEVAGNTLTVGGNMADNVFFGTGFFGTTSGVASGFSVDSVGNILTHGMQLFNTATGGWSIPAYNPSTAVRFASAAVFADVAGNVLIAGGTDAAQSQQTDTAQLFDPTTGQVEVVANVMRAERSLGVATILSNGDLAVIGGFGNGKARNDFEVFDGSDFQTNTNLTHARFNHTVTPLLTGDLLVCGGSNGSAVHRTAELVTP